MINYLIIVVAIIMTLYNIYIYSSKNMPKDSRTTEAIVNEIIAGLLVAVVDFYPYSAVISWILIIVIIALTPIVYSLHQKNKVIKIRRNMKYQLHSTKNLSDSDNFDQVIRGMQMYFTLLKVLSDSYDKETVHQLERVKALIRVKFLNISTLNRNSIAKGKIIQYLLHAKIPTSQNDAKVERNIMKHIIKESIK